MTAPSRDAVFTILRAQGIKPIKVVAADGSKANGEVRGVRKRMVIVCAVLAALIAGSLVYAVVSRSGESGSLQIARPLPRQTILGDRKRIDGAAQTLFPTKAERFLARFVEPGRPFVAPESEWPTRAEFDAVLDKPVCHSETELTEYIDLKRMVEELKREMRVYLKGGGYVGGYVKALIDRQNTEVQLRQKYEREITDLLSQTAVVKVMGKDPTSNLKPAYEHWVMANAHLQTLGIYPIPIPVRLRTYQLTLGMED